MPAVDIDVNYVAHLARLELDANEATVLSSQLTHILSYIEKLRELDISSVEPMAHAVPLVNVTRPDEPRPSLPLEAALGNAPARSNDLFLVPKIVE